jgi:hypothetical protein
MPHAYRPDRVRTLSGLANLASVACALQLWRVTGTFFQKTISAGQIISALLIRLQITFTKQFLIGPGVGGPG